MPVIMPIIVPQKPRDCITSSGKTYCVDKPMTHSDQVGLGIVILIVVVWFVAGLASIEAYNPLVPLAVFLGPIILFALGCILF